MGEVVGVWFHDEDGFVGCREGEGVVAQQPELQGTANLGVRVRVRAVGAWR